MPDREKVIKGFENCVFNYCDDDCMYKDEEWKASGFAACRHFAREDIVEIPKRVLFDVLELMKSQEPRVMTLEEVLTTDKPFFIEKPSNEDGDKEWRGWGVVDTEDREAGTIMFAVIGKSQRLLCDVETMGEYFRCWTARPTAEQREATPWEN